MSSAGRWATQAVSRLSASAPTSVSMCPASASSASDPLIQPPMASSTMNVPVSPSTAQSRGIGVAGLRVRWAQSVRTAVVAMRER